MKQLQSNIIRYKIIAKHLNLVKNGDYLTAKALLHLLRCKRIAVGLDDVGYAVEHFLEDIGLRPSYSRQFTTAYFRL